MSKETCVSSKRGLLGKDALPRDVGVHDERRAEEERARARARGSERESEELFDLSDCVLPRGHARRSRPFVSTSVRAQGQVSACLSPRHLLMTRRRDIAHADACVEAYEHAGCKHACVSSRGIAGINPFSLPRPSLSCQQGQALTHTFIQWLVCMLMRIHKRVRHCQCHPGRARDKRQPT